MWQCIISNSGYVGPKWHRKIYNVGLRAERRRELRKDDDVEGSRTAWGRWHHRLKDIAGSGRMTPLWARWRRRVDGVAGSGTVWGKQRHELGEDDDVAGSVVEQSQRCHGHGNDVCVVDGITGLGWGCWPRVSRAQSGSGMMARRLWGELDEGASCR
jgi:hypothetical protein